MFQALRVAFLIVGERWKTSWRLVVTDLKPTSTLTEIVGKLKAGYAADF